MPLLLRCVHASVPSTPGFMRRNPVYIILLSYFRGMVTGTDGVAAEAAVLTDVFVVRWCCSAVVL